MPFQANLWIALLIVTAIPALSQEPRATLVADHYKEYSGPRPLAAGDGAIIGLQLGLVLKRVHARHRPFHEDEDDAFGLRWEMRRMRSERLLRTESASRLLAEQAGQREVSEAAAGGFQ